MRCQHGFETSVVACPMRCGQTAKKVPQLHVDPRVDSLVREVGAELGVDVSSFLSSGEHYSRGELSVPVRLRAEVARRAYQRFGLSQTAVARALGVRLKDIQYALKRSAGETEDSSAKPALVWTNDHKIRRLEIRRACERRLNVQAAGGSK